MDSQFGEIDPSNSASAFSSHLRLADGPIDLSWHHCSTTAEFVGELYGLRCRAQDMAYNDARHSIGYMVNELLENAVKFRAGGDITVQASLEENRFELKVANHIAAETAERFQGLLAGIEGRDPGELLIERIEANAEDANSSGSGLGLLTLMSDYGVRLGWSFRKVAAGESIRLETFAALDIA